MDARDHNVVVFPTVRVCGLEWVTWAMDAAREYREAREPAATSDLPSFYLAEHLSIT